MALTRDDYRRQLHALAPPGAALPDALDSQWQQLLDALAAVLGEVDSRAEDLLRESDPRRTAELLTDWERVVALPGPCDALAPTLQERRNQLVAKLTSIGGQSRAYFIGLAAALGYEITITEFNPFRAGFSHAGDSLTNDTWLHWWMVNAPGTQVFPFLAGRSAAGEPLRSWGDERLECPIRDKKPAHTQVAFSYAV
jgi:uncharacterized protein YmfQ (DUF2313 family)